jgi:hypothetical protein
MPPRLALRTRAEQAEQEAKRLAKEVRAQREPACAALGELKVGVEKAWGELKSALDSAITKFRQSSLTAVTPVDALWTGSGCPA